MCSSLSFPSKQVPETGADRWGGCVTVCLVLSERCVEGYTEPPVMALRGPSPRDRGETVRKLSPYDVFPPSQRRFRRDTRGSQESYGSVGGMENRTKSVWGHPVPKEKEREKVYGQRK